MTQEQPEGLPGYARPPIVDGLLALAVRRWPLVLLGVVGALAGATAYYAWAAPVYQAVAQVLVVKKRPDAVTGVDTRALSMDDYVGTHQTLLRSTLLVERAIQKHGLSARADLTHEPDGLTETIINGLTVTRTKTGSWGADNILVLSFQGTSAAVCPVVLNAVIDAFKDFLDETHQDLSEETLRLITQARDVLHTDLQQREAAYRQFRKQAPALVWKGKEQVSLRLERLAGIEARRSVVLLRQAELRGQLAALDEGIKTNGRREALLAQVAAWSAQAEASRGTQPVTAQDRLQPLLMEEQKLLETHGERHPEVVSLRNRIAVTRELLAGPAASWLSIPELGEQKGRPRPADPVDLYRQYCQQELLHLDITEQGLLKLSAEEHNQARELTAYEVEDENYRTAIDRSQRLYDSILKQLQHIDLAKGVGGYDARVITPPVAGKKVRPAPAWLFSGAAFLGLLGGLGLACLRELAATNR